MLEGLGDLLEDNHMKNIVELRKAPEVARDYIFSKVSNLEVPEQAAPTMSGKKLLEQSTVEKCRAFDPETGDVNAIWAAL